MSVPIELDHETECLEFCYTSGNVEQLKRKFIAKKKLAPWYNDRDNERPHEN